MGRWRGFLDSLDTGGGHIFTLFVLICLGGAMFFWDNTAGGQIITGAFGALLMMLKSVGSNRDQVATMATTVATTTVTSPDPNLPPPSDPSKSTGS